MINDKSKQMIEIVKDIEANIYKIPRSDQQDFRNKVLHLSKGLERPGRPSTSTDKQRVNQIKEFVHKNRRLTIMDLSDTIGILRGSLNTVSKDILGRQLVVFASR